ncbi:GNAT family N-acetyltransferase [Actinomyces sp. B33]|uniref:GNAT family N-acetyltransferase n=1 Tax=Actinomyces sp. B33 TaxID=2942131 RepID=UPI00234067F4|nr:GNAT family N-acetyltransferase [Actinomyces sp. B33]MDC4233181.1 GNAT family N-acetyltransferase [Actinomyces sp. B33]
MTGLAERLAPPESVPYPGEHLGLRWRTFTASDAPAVFDLIRSVEHADSSFRRTGAGEIADMIEGRFGRDWVDTIIGLDADRRICAVGIVRVLRAVDDGAHAVINAFIHPHWRGRGIGRALLYWQDGRARQMLVEAFGGQSPIPASIANFVDAHMTDRRRLYIAAGFYAKRTFQVMYRELTGGEIMPQARHGYRVVGWDDAPIDRVRDIHLRAFRDHFHSQMSPVWWDEAMNELDPRWSFIALSPEGEPVGYCLTGRPADRWAATGRTEAYVSLLGVDRDHRGKSLARVLLESSAAAAAANGMTRIGLDVDTLSASNAHGIYEHLGFVDDQAEVYYTIDL